MPKAGDDTVTFRYGITSRRKKARQKATIQVTLALLSIQ